jgi:hypothetical protein
VSYKTLLWPYLCQLSDANDPWIARAGLSEATLSGNMHLRRYVPTCLRQLLDAYSIAVQFVLFAISTGGSVSFSSYILRAITYDAQDGSWLNRGIAIAAITGQ